MQVAHFFVLAGVEEYKMGGVAIEHRFNPYRENGGSVAAIAGDDFVIIASDTRCAPE
jgi:20S proteasome alpha/beta subunit